MPSEPPFPEVPGGTTMANDVSANVVGSKVCSRVAFPLPLVPVTTPTTFPCVESHAIDHVSFTPIAAEAPIEPVPVRSSLNRRVVVPSFVTVHKRLLVASQNDDPKSPNNELTGSIPTRVQWVSCARELSSR